MALVGSARDVRLQRGLSQRGLETNLTTQQVPQVQAAESLGTGQTHHRNVTRPVEQGSADICDGFYGCVDGIRAFLGRDDEQHRARHQMNAGEISRLRELIETQQRTLNELTSRLNLSNEVTRRPHEIEFASVDLTKNFHNGKGKKQKLDFDDESNSDWTEEHQTPQYATDEQKQHRNNIKQWSNTHGIDQSSMHRINPESGAIEYKRQSSLKQTPYLASFQNLQPVNATRMLNAGSAAT